MTQTQEECLQEVLRVILRDGDKYDDDDVLRYKKYVLCIQIMY